MRGLFTNRGISDEHLDFRCPRPGGGRRRGPADFRQILALVVFVVLLLPVDPSAAEACEGTPGHASKLATGDEVVSAGGILGRVTEAATAFVTIEIADGVRIKVQKGQITPCPKGTYKGN